MVESTTAVATTSIRGGQSVGRYPRRALLAVVAAALHLLFGKRRVVARALLAAAVAQVLMQWRARRRHGIEVAGRRILVTGASSGVGAAVCAEFARLGAAGLILVGRDRSRLDRTRAAVVAEGGVIEAIYPIDVSNADSVEMMSQDLRTSTEGVPDVIVHCAGAGRWRHLHETSAQEMLSCLDAPAVGAMLISRALMPDLLRLPRASIVLVQSPAAYQPVPGATAYVVSRYALRGLAEALAADLFGSHIHVCTVVLNEIADSAYFAADDEGHSRLPWIKSLLGHSLTSAQAAAAIVSALRGGGSFHAAPGLLAINLWLREWLPSLYFRLTVLTSNARLVALQQ